MQEIIWFFAGTYFQSGDYAGFLRCAYRSLRLDLRQCRYLVEFPLRKIRRQEGDRS